MSAVGSLGAFVAGTFIHRERQAALKFFEHAMQILISAVNITIPRCSLRNRAPIGGANEHRIGSFESQSRNGMGMTEQDQRLAKEREEITARVASFRAMQEKFEREREEYCTRTLRKAREGKPYSHKPNPRWR